MRTDDAPFLAHPQERMMLLPHLRSPSPCMAKLDRLSWTAGLVFEAYGVRIGIRTDRADVLDQVRATLPPGAVEVEVPDGLVPHLFSLKVGVATERMRPFTLVYDGITRRARTPLLEDALFALEGSLMRCVATHARQYVFVHAGVVGWKGQAIVLPGRSTAGKSTLVRALLEAGATYYSDDYAVLDAHGHVWPYQRPISTRLPNAVLQRSTAAEFGAEVGTEPLPIGVLAFTEYHEGRTWRPRPLPAGQALWELVQHSCAALDAPAHALPYLEHAIATASRWRGPRGEARDMVDDLLRRVAPLPAMA